MCTECSLLPFVSWHTHKPIGTRSVELSLCCCFLFYFVLYIFYYAQELAMATTADNNLEYQTIANVNAKHAWLYHFFQLNSCALWWKIKYMYIYILTVPSLQIYSFYLLFVECLFNSINSAHQEWTTSFFRTYKWRSNL